MKKYTKETSVGIFVLIGLLCVGYLTLKLGKLDIMGGDSYMIEARFTNVSGLKPGASVEIAGVSVGEVFSITLDQDYGVAVVRLQIDNGVELTDEASASVKTSGLIGDKYIKLTPGAGMDTLAAGDTIFDTEPALDVEELISKFAFGDV